MSGETYFYRIHEDAIIPSYAEEQASGLDLSCLEDVSLCPGKVTLVRTGLAVKPPIGYYYDLCLRSSTPVKNEGLVLANGIGIIDASYSSCQDELKIPILNVARQSHYFKKGQRIAQLVLRELFQPKVVEVEKDQMSRIERGGFGSTG